MKNRELLQLAHKYNPLKHSIGGWYASEKLDGMRAFWDGGITRGVLASQIPFANTQKDYRRLSPPYSTGLWSRYGKTIAAPDWWLDGLPDFPLDGELYLGPGKFQALMSIVKQYNPADSDWKEVKFQVFDLPSYQSFFQPGRIKNPHWTLTIDSSIQVPVDHFGPISFNKVCRLIELEIVNLGTAHWVEQKKLPMQTEKALTLLDDYMDQVLNQGGEGLILRKPESVWEPKRSYNLLKVKSYLDDEATVVGYIWGKGKLEGLMGALVCNWNGKQFELSGFTEEERVLYYLDTGSRADGVPGERASEHITCAHFPIGSKVTFRYRELTDKGIPKEARYWRKR